MTPEERSLLQQILQDFRQSTGAAKDPEAEQMISNAVGANPDAAYLLVQHALIADQALHAAQAQIEALQGQLAPPSTAFRGGPAVSPDGPTQAQSGPFASNSGLGGFLRSAGTMVAGVAGGEFLAQGLSNIFSPRD